MPVKVDSNSDIAARRRKYTRLMSAAHEAYGRGLAEAEAEFREATDAARAEYTKAVAPFAKAFEAATKEPQAKYDARVAELEREVGEAHQAASVAAGLAPAAPVTDGSKSDKAA